MFRQWDIIPFLSVHAMCLGAFLIGFKPEWLLLECFNFSWRFLP